MRSTTRQAVGPSWMVTSYGYASMMFRSYHWREMGTSPLDGYVGQIWDDFNDVDAYETAEMDEKTIGQIFTAKVAHFGFANMDIPNPFGSKDEPIWKRGSLYAITMPKDKWKAVIADFIAWVGEQAKGVGGDDSYFDYYPDIWDVVWQIVDVTEALLNDSEIRKLAEFSLQVAVNTRYFDSNSPTDYTSEFYSILPGYDEKMGMIRQSMVKRGYLTEDGEMTEKGMAWIVDHTFDELDTK